MTINNPVLPRKFILTLASILLLISCSKPSSPPEQAIEQQLNKAVDALEKLDSDALFEILADGFDVRGSIDRNANANTFNEEKIKQSMMLFRLRKQSISVTLTGLEIKLDPYNTQLATAETKALITGGRGLLPEDGRLYTVKSSWRLYDDEWKITQLSWQ